jgi:hypothetical protein
MPRVRFHPETDGYAFANSWTFDDNEKQQLEQAIADLLPLAEDAASPIYLPIIQPFLDAEFAWAGWAAPVLVEAERTLITSGIQSGINSAISAMGYGLCGGMAFSSLDYWLRQWIVPRGTGAGDQPSRATPKGTTLRDYLWGRLLDSIHDNGVQFLTWMYIGQLPFDLGCSWLNGQTAGQFPIIKKAIDSGTPAPIGLIGTTWNPLDNHQVLCYGYDDYLDGTGSLYLYDNNNPGVESRIDFDLRGDSLATTKDDTYKDPRGPLRAFFATVYAPQTPPKTVVLDSSLAVSPGCVQAKLPFTATYSVLNVGFHQSPAMELQVVEGATPAGGETTFNALAEGAVRVVSAQVTLDTPGWHTLSVLADLGTVGGDPAHVVKQIPPADTAEIGTVQLNVQPPLRIAIQPPDANDHCSLILSRAAGETATFALSSSPAVPPGGTYQWSAQGGASLGANNGPTFQAQMPSPAGTDVTVSVVITYNNGCSRSGTLTLKSLNFGSALAAASMCHVGGALRNLFPVQYPITPDEPLRPPIPIPLGDLLTRERVLALQRVAQQWAQDLDAALVASSGAARGAPNALGGPGATSPAMPLSVAPRATAGSNAGNESTIIMSLSTGQARGLLRTPLGLTFPLVTDRAEIGRGITNTEEAAAIDLTPEQDKLTVSRIHALIARAGDRFELEDLRSANGTTLNGQKLIAGQRYPLQNGDVIEFGRVRCVFMRG